MSPLHVARAACLACLLPALAQANLLNNPSFEAGSFSGGSFGYPLGMQLFTGSTAITGWTVAGELAWFKTGQANLTAQDGSNAIDLTGFCDLGYNGAAACGPLGTGGSYGGISQSIATITGATYSLSYWGGNYGVNGSAPTLFAQAGATQRTNVLSAAPTTGAWESFSFNFVATSTNTLIRFTGSGGTVGLTYYLGLDNVAVELVSLPVPEPATHALMLGGVALLGIATRRRVTPRP